MRRITLAALIAAALLSCQNPNQPKDQGDGEQRAGGKSRASGNAKPAATRTPLVPGTKPSGGSTGTGGTGGSGGDPTAEPTLIPATGAPFPDSSAPADLALTFEGISGTWAIRPYLNRARAGVVAGSLKDRLIVAEGEHRPSFEYLQVGTATWILDDAYDGELGATGESRVLHQGVSLATGGVAGDTELWTAGGLAGALAPDGTTGQTGFALYRDTGFATARKPEEGQFNLGKGRYAAAGGVVGTDLVVAGGIAKPGVIASEVEVVNLTKLVDGKRAGAAMPVPVAGAATAMLDGKLYVIGGYTFNLGKASPVTHVQVYDVAANKWEKDGPVPALPAAVHGAAAAVLNGTLYLIGGYDAGGKPTGTMRQFSLIAGSTWDAGPAMPTPRALHALVAHQGELWAIGGVGTGKGALQTVESYRP